MIKRTFKPKISTIILSGVFALIVLGVFASDVILKNEYDSMDKNDPYWDYFRILEKPYSHVKIDGAYVTRISFQQNKKPSVRVSQSWAAADRDSVMKLAVHQDTLFINFLPNLKNRADKEWMRRSQLLRLFAPKLLSITANNVNMEVNKFTQSDIAINLMGKSKIEVQSYKNHLGNINVVQRDSSSVEFEMADDFKGSHSMVFDTVTADLKGYSALNIGYGYANKLNLNIEDGSAIVLSGKSLKTLKK